MLAIWTRHREALTCFLYVKRWQFSTYEAFYFLALQEEW